MVNRKLHPKKFFTKEEKERIVEAIRAAEKKTSAEIRVYLENRPKEDSMTRARKVFEKLGMARTRHRNGVLIYFSLKEQAFAILGDQGIHEKAGSGFWQAAVEKMQERFLQNDFAGGLEDGIQSLGEKLTRYFPREADDTNELPDGL